MDASPFPEKSIFEYIISIYLPGSLVAIVFLYAIETNGLVQKYADNVPFIKIETKDPEGQDPEGQDPRGNLLLAVYTFYFISTPFIFGGLADGFRHCVAERISDSCKEKFTFLKWNYPRKEGYKKVKKELSENIYSRQLDKSYFLFHAYEFYGNFNCAILIASFIYFLNCFSIWLSDYIKWFSVSSYSIFLLLIAAFTFILCYFSMRYFWRENNHLSNDWGLYGEIIESKPDTQSHDVSLYPVKVEKNSKINSGLFVFLIAFSLWLFFLFCVINRPAVL